MEQRKKNVGLPFVSAPPPVRFRAFKDLIEKKKEWVKLNGSYVAGTVASTSAAFVAAQIAEKMGVERSHAVTWIAGFSAFVAGTAAICISWKFSHKQIYENHPERFRKDGLHFIGLTFVAQAITWAFSWSATAFAVAVGASNAVAVTIQQIVDRLVFIPLFNFLNRNKVREMERTEQK